jgi:hypothetical protein
MTTVDGWKKSSRSQNTSNCVEVFRCLDAVRDSKNPVGGVLRADLPSLVRAIREDRFAR